MILHSHRDSVVRPNLCPGTTDYHRHSDNDQHVTVIPSGVAKICSHENLMACVEQSEALSRKAKQIAFLFKATKAKETTK
jgi:hypothetical protein